jgi:SAM-dependent methyltransferase
VDLKAFVFAHLPSTRARVLEVGCGTGDLARALADAGHAVTAIDPRAPEGPPFRRVTLEELSEPGPFDAVVAGHALHHLHELRAAVTKIAALLVPGGRFIVGDYAKERVDRPTAEWYYDRRLALAAAGGKAAPGSYEQCMREWQEDEAGIHTYATMRAELDRRFSERYFAWVPYFCHELRSAAPEAVEQKLIDAGTIRATGFLYVGETAMP